MKKVFSIAEIDKIIKEDKLRLEGRKGHFIFEIIKSGGDPLVMLDESYTNSCFYTKCHTTASGSLTIVP